MGMGLDLGNTHFVTKINDCAAAVLCSGASDSSRQHRL